MKKIVDGIKKFSLFWFFIFTFSKLLAGIGIGVLLVKYLEPYGWSFLILGIGLSLTCIAKALRNQ